MVRRMNRYYFDLRDGDAVAPDDVGMDLPDLRAVREEAARSLADLVKFANREVRRRDSTHDMSIEVRDVSGPVLQAKFVLAQRKLH